MSKKSKAKYLFTLVFVALGMISFVHAVGLTTGLYYLDLGLCGGFAQLLVDSK